MNLSEDIERLKDGVWIHIISLRVIDPLHEAFDWGYGSLFCFDGLEPFVGGNESSSAQRKPHAVLEVALDGQIGASREKLQLAEAAHACSSGSTCDFWVLLVQRN